MADYYINSDKGKELANSLRAGDMAEASDGSLWKKEADGSITVTKNGQSMTGRVGVSAPTLSETSETNFTPTIETPVLNAETSNAVPSVMESNLDATQDTKQVRSAVLASEKAKQATEAVTSGLTQDTGNDELLNQAIQQALQPDNYTIGSAKGVLMTDKMQKAGDLAEAADGSLWKRNEDGSITVTKDGKTYTATVDREAGKRDPQWAALTAPPASAENSSAKKGKGGAGSGGGSGTYSTTVSAASTQQSSAQDTGSGTDRATLRKQAATAQKEMGDLARQISVAKIRGKDTSALQKQYNEAKARYDAANTQIESTQQTADKKNAWQSLPTVQDTERFSNIGNVTTGRVRDTEQQVVNAVLEETQKHAWESLPTVQDTERFGNLPDGLSLIQQATAQQGKTLTGKPYIPTNDGGFTHSSGSTKRQNIFERIGNATLGGLLQSGGASMDAAGTMYQAGQGGRDTTYGESRAWFQNQLDSELRTLNSMLLENRQNPGTYTSAEIKNQRRIIAEAQARVNAFALTQDAQQQSGELARDLAADVSNYGADRVETAKAGASKLGSMALDALASTVQSGADMAANVALGTNGSMIPFAFRAFGGGTQQARNDGADLAQQLTYGGAMAAKEVFTEKMFNIAGLQSKAYGKGSFDDYVEKAVAGAVDKLASTDTGKRLLGGAAQFMTSAAGEGLEELIGDWMEWQLPRIYGKEPDSAKEVAANSLYDFLVGAISGTMGNLTTLGQFTNYNVNEHLGRSQNTQDALLDQAVQTAIRGETLTMPTQSVDQSAHQMTQATQERGAGDVITGGEANRNSAAPEQTTESPINGPVRSGAAEAGTVNINDGTEKIKIDFKKLIEKNNGSLSVNQLVDYGNSLSRTDAQSLMSFLDDIDSGKTPYKYDAAGSIHEIDPNSHIDNRDMSMRMKRGQHSFQYNNPEIHEYMKQAAEMLLDEIQNSTRGERFATPAKNGGDSAGGYNWNSVGGFNWTGVKRHTTEGIAYLKDNFGISWDNLAKAAENIIKDEGAENYADANRVEMLLDDMLTHGYQSLSNQNEFHSYSIPPNEAYIAAKSAIPGASKQYKQESAMDFLFEEMDNADNARKTPETVARPGNSSNQSVLSNDMGAMRSQFESVPKQSQTQSNTINSMETGWNVPEPQRASIMYDTISEAKSLDNARLRLAQDYAGEMTELRGKHNWSGEEVDMGMTILDNYRRAAEQTGDWSQYSEWRKVVAAHGTTAGQALQAYAKYSRQTGGGIVADASTALERAAAKTNKAEIMSRVSTLSQQYDAAVGTGRENAKVNVDDLVDIIKSASTARQTGTLIGNKTPAIVNWAMNRIANYAKAEAQSGSGENLDFLKTFAADSIYNIAADTRTVSAGEKVKTVRRMGMLSKVSTVMRNLVSNNVFDPIDSVARNISVPLDMLVSTITGTRSVAGDASWASAAKRKGSMDGLARACMEVGLDVDTSGTAGKYENTSNRTFKMSGSVFSKLISVWEAYEGYTLNATDEFQKGGIEASVQQGIDKLYEKGKIKDASLRDAGKQEALYRTFQDKTVLSDAAIGVRNALNKAHIGDVGAGDIVLPFAQVPSNLGARAIEYSPAGLVVAATDFINMVNSAKNGELTAAQQAKAVQGVGRALTGSGMIAIAAAAALRGWLKVTGDDDDKNKDALSKTFGLDGTQLNISAALRDIRGEDAEWRDGDQLLSIGFLDPLNAQLTTGALIADDIRSEEGVTVGRVLGNSLSGALQSVLDTPVMSTFQDVANNYEYSTASTPGGKVLDAAQKYAANQLSSVIPNSLRGIAQGLDDTERNAYSSDNVWQQALDNAKASIPGLRETLPAKTDIWGNPIKNEGGVRNFMNRNINPGNITTYKTDEVSAELEKISEATNTSLYPSRTAPRSLSVNDEKIGLTFEQRSMYQKAYGDAYYSAVTALMNDKNYKAMPDSMKAEILKQAEDVATEQARNSLGIGYEMKDSAQKILDKSGTDRNNAIIAAAVTAQHYMSESTQELLSKVEQQLAGADYIGMSDELLDSAKEKANTYFLAVEAAKYGKELTATQQDLSDKSNKELARYFMDKAIESRYADTNKNGTKADEYLKAYQLGEINSAMALAVLSDKEITAYDRFGKSANVTPEMALQAANVHAGMKDIKDEDGKVINSAEKQFDDWLEKQKWTDDQKSAIRMGFYLDSTKTYAYLAEQLRKGNISTPTAKSELTSSYQAGWSHNVKDTGAKMADYLDAIVEYQERPSEDERKAAGYKNTWTWFCDYLNTTDLTQEQKYAIAISMSDYADSTKKKIWDRLR